MLKGVTAVILRFSTKFVSCGTNVKVIKGRPILYATKMYSIKKSSFSNTFTAIFSEFSENALVREREAPLSKAII